nr:MAG TPA: hypothetical protein [Caudoviricetes sp.]
MSLISSALFPAVNREIHRGRGQPRKAGNISFRIRTGITHPSDFF